MWKWFKRIKPSDAKVDEVTYDSITLHDFVEQVISETIDPLIWEEFADRLKSTEQRYLAKLLKDINALQHKYNLVKLIVQEMIIHRRIKLIDPTIPLPELDEIWKILMNIIPARKTDSPEVIVARSNKLIEQIKTKQREAQQIQPMTSGGRVDRSYFSRMIASVATYHKVQINKKIMLLCEFVEYILIMREQQKEMEIEIQKHKSK